MPEAIDKSRRHFMQAAAAATAGGVLLPSVLPAFGQDAGATRLRVGLTPPATQVTLGFMSENTGTGPLQPMYEFLAIADRFTGEIVPNLASDWQRSDDARQWRVKLRSDVKFHDGTPFTAKDVVLSFNLITAEDSRATTAAVFRKLMKSADNIEVVNDHELVFQLDVAEPELPYYLTQGLLIYSKDYWDKVGQDGYAAAPIGTGPFKFKEFRPSQYILYSRVENHWRQTPEFGELQLMYMPEDTTRLAALLAGEIDIAEIPRAVQNQALARGKAIVPSTRPAVIVSAKFGGNYLKPKGDKLNGPLTNKLVREAMNLAVNRDEINQQIFNGHGVIAVVEGYQPTDPEYNPDWKPYAFDPDKAKALLAEAGYKDGFDFDMTVVTPPGFPEVPTVVEAMSIYFTNIGLRPNLVQMEVSDQNDKQRSSDFYNTLYSNRQPLKPLFQAMEYFWSKGIYHFFEDPFIEEKMAKFPTGTAAEREQIIKDIGNFLHDQHASLPIVYLNAEVAIDPKVVAEYKADIAGFGASVGHEYTKAAK
ncbi:MAG TPA: ABC transporter substrate-binding protein [Devosiaceae bacterium]|jgi:peptide/nickel transport system substrate-binding protein